MFLLIFLSAFSSRGRVGYRALEIGHGLKGLGAGHLHSPFLPSPPPTPLLPLPRPAGKLIGIREEGGWGVGHRGGESGCKRGM